MDDANDNKDGDSENDGDDEADEDDEHDDENDDDESRVKSGGSGNLVKLVKKDVKMKSLNVSRFELLAFMTFLGFSLCLST